MLHTPPPLQRVGTPQQIFAAPAPARLNTELLPPPTTTVPSNLSPYDVTTPSAITRRPSTPPTQPTSAMPREQLEQNSRQARKLARLIDKVLLRRTQVEYQRQSLMHKLRFHDESAGALQIALSALALDSITPAQVQHIVERQAQNRKDYEAVELQSEVLRDLQSSLSNLEYELERKQQNLVDAFDALGARLPIDPADTESLDDPQLPSAVSDTPSLLRKLYDRKGDVVIHSERLDEHEQFYFEGLAERGLVADRGDELLITDEQFEREYDAGNNRITSDLAAAQADVVHLMAECGESRAHSRAWPCAFGS